MASNSCLRQRERACGWRSGKRDAAAMVSDTVCHHTASASQPCHKAAPAEWAPRRRRWAASRTAQTGRLRVEDAKQGQRPLVVVAKLARPVAILELPSCILSSSMPCCIPWSLTRQRQEERHNHLQAGGQLRGLCKRIL